MNPLPYIAVALVAEIVFVFGFFFSDFLHLALKTVLVATRIYRRYSLGRDIFQGIWVGFGACAGAIAVGILIARAFGLHGNSIYLIILLWPFLAELHDIYTRRISNKASGCLVRNLHGAMKTPSQRALFAGLRTDYGDQYPDKTDDELFGMSYRHANLTLSRMFFGEIIGGGLAIWVVTRLLGPA